MPLVTVEFTGERNVGRLATGDFTQTVVGNRLRVNISPDLSISSYVQYDTDSDSVGTNTRLRWTFRPVADLFVVYNHNVRSLLDRWRLDSNQLLVKLQYAWRLDLARLARCGVVQSSCPDSDFCSGRGVRQCHRCAVMHRIAPASGLRRAARRSCAWSDETEAET